MPALRTIRICTLIAATVAALAIAAPAHAATITVDETEDELNTDGDCSLREAIQAANINGTVDGCPAGSASETDTVVVPAGTYPLSIAGGDEPLNETGDLDVFDPVIIDGASARTTIIDGNDIDRIFHFVPSANTSQLLDLTVQDGKEQVSDDCGGAIMVEDAVLEATRIAVLDSESRCGGGLSVNQAAAQLTLREALVANNRATTGEDVGGGLLIEQGATATIENVTVSGNLATNHGGGIWVQGSTATLNNVTIADNVADSDADGSGEGGGLQIDSGTATLSNTIVGDNQDDSTGTDPKHPDCSGTLTSSGYNLIEDTTGCTITGTTTGNITGQDPRLDPLADNGGPTDTHQLKNNSPAVDAGNPGPTDGTGSNCEPVDQRGFNRPRGARCDIGAFERGAGPGERPKCFNKKVTLEGTEGDDALVGTPQRDVILSLGGNDTIASGGGNDLVCGGAGNDGVRTQAGADKAKGNAGKDRIRGGGAGDTLLGNAQRDRLVGQGGADLLKGGGGSDRLNGGGGDDTCAGGPGKDRERKC